MNGVLLVDKPSGLTSHDVVNRVRAALQERSVGHLGTLDPMATGVLPLVSGNLTRLAQFYLNSEKTYEGTIRFGFSTDTYDAEGEPTSPQIHAQVSLEQLRELAVRFRGPIEQMPPPFSAKKIHGVPAYKLARKHKQVALKPVPVEIKDFKILDLRDEVFESNHLLVRELPAKQGICATFQARVSSGTYMRSVAHDLGQLLGCGAHLAGLRRTQVAEFTLADAHALEVIDSMARAKEWDRIFIHPRKLLPDMPSVAVNDETAALIRSGRAVNLPDLSRARRVKVFHGQRELIAIASRVAGTLFHPGIVLSPPIPSFAGGRRP
jgi:tRNA pseudouridine55 synthase